MARTPTVAEIVDHYLAAHKQGRTLSTIAQELRRATGAGSDTSLSAWRKGMRRPPMAAVRTLRRICGCQHPEYGNEVISHAFGHAAVSTVPRPKPPSNRASTPTPTPPRPPRFIVGRDAELREVTAMGRVETRHRVLNIFGPGGIGKTEVFHRLVASANDRDIAVGHADVVEARYIDPRTPFHPSGILAAFAATLGGTELEPLRRELDTIERARTFLDASGGVDVLFGADGRRLDPDAIATAAGAPEHLREIFRDRFVLERYFRQSTRKLTHLFCEGIGAMTDTVGAIILSIDTYEEIAELDGWVCRELVPRLPERVGLVIFGRNALSKTNIDWVDRQDIVRERPLLELPRKDAMSYLRHYGLTDPQGRQGVYAVTGGYPLLLVLARSLAQESGGWLAIGDLGRERDRDAIASTLLDRLLREEKMRRVAGVIADCALAPWINPEIIAVLMRIAPAEAHELYRQLQTHSIVTPHPRGLVLHEKIRELLRARLKFADRDRYETLQGALAGYLGAKAGVAHA